MHKSIYILICIVLALNLISFAPAETIDRVVAKVGSEAIFLSDLQQAMQAYKLVKNPPTTDEILQQLIDRALLLQEAKRLKIIPSDIAVKGESKRQFAQIRSAFRSDMDFQQELQKEGLSISILEEQFTRRAREELMIRILLRKKTEPITDTQVDKFNTENPDKAKQINKVRIRHIFFSLDTNATDQDRIAVLDKANIALSKLKSGEKWEDITKAYSDDESTRADSGDLGYIAHGDILPEIESIAFDLPIGKISDIIKTEQGFHIIQVTDKSAAKQYLESEAIKATHANLIKKLRETTKIEIKL
jgi:parvulin-like peptidyl-prolyl isomerase